MKDGSEAGRALSGAVAPKGPASWLRPAPNKSSSSSAKGSDRPLKGILNACV